MIRNLGAKRAVLEICSLKNSRIVVVQYWYFSSQLLSVYCQLLGDRLWLLSDGERTTFFVDSEWKPICINKNFSDFDVH